ncbi:MAG: TIGR03557 family F420-dependent LLM class oxidoreductase [Halapricum sp.]
MTELGYALSGEEHGPTELVDAAARAEEVGFGFALISDHYHPWIGKQGNAPFVWNVIGGIARATDDLRLGTGVTCPTIRYPPALVAQAAATSAAAMEDRFFLGVGTGENLNEHILGDRWPPHHVRLEMLEEAVEVIRDLWTGEMISHHGEYYTVEDARIFTLPESPPPIHVAASGEEAADAAGRIGDGLVSTAPSESVVQSFEGAGGDGPKYGQATVCWAESEAEAERTAYEWWPNGAVTGQVSQELPTPTHFEQAAKMVSKEDVAKSVVCGPDAQAHVDHLQQFADAGFDHVYVHQIGPDQEGFFEFYEEEVMPSFS